MKRLPELEDMFLQGWWWDAVCPESCRQQLVVEGEGGIDAFWPLYTARRLRIFPVWANPPLTQHNGPFLKDRKYFKNLLLQIPHRQLLRVNLNFKLNEEEEAVCRRAGLECIERVTYKINDTSNLEQVWAGISSMQQRQIKKAEKHLHKVDNPDIEWLITVLQQTFRRRKTPMPYSADLVRMLYSAVKQHNAGELVALADAKNRICAAGLFVYDRRAVYSLAHGYVKTESNLGAGSLLQWEGIKIAARKELIFDFEGSNIESIAKFNSSFGASKFTYTQLQRLNAPIRIWEKINRRKIRPK